LLGDGDLVVDEDGGLHEASPKGGTPSLYGRGLTVDRRGYPGPRDLAPELVGRATTSPADRVTTGAPLKSRGLRATKTSAPTHAMILLSRR
jgi:hypothetical protein